MDGRADEFDCWIDTGIDTPTEDNPIEDAIEDPIDVWTVSRWFEHGDRVA